jgi:lon-related putative ATP-dependent protease
MNRIASEKYRLSSDKLKLVCTEKDAALFYDPEQEGDELDGLIGQEQGIRSLTFGLAMEAPGYNIYVTGPQGTGKSTCTMKIVTDFAVAGKEPEDWCYLNNFDIQDQPLAVSLPAGQGRVFQRDMEVLVEDLKVFIPKAFQSSVYEKKKTSIVESLQNKMDSLFQRMEEVAAENSYTLQQIPPRIMLIPMKDGKPIPKEDFDSLPQEEREKMEERGRFLGQKLDEALREGQKYENKAKEAIAQLEQSVAAVAAEFQINRLKDKYKDFPKVIHYLDQILEDVKENHLIFRIPDGGMGQMVPFVNPEEQDPFSRFKVNVFVSHEPGKGAPVVFESSPYYYNIFGKIEYKSQVLAVSTDFTMIKSGAIHQANGGYLILNVHDLLSDPFSWEALKKALKYGKTTVENIGEQYRLVPTVGLKPEPIPLNLKLILLGTPYLFILLDYYDEDFRRLFKVKADFDSTMKRTPENLKKYAHFVGQTCRKENQLPLTTGAMGSLVEYGSRLAGDQEKLSTRFNLLANLIYEASALARQAHAPQVERGHMEKAIEDMRSRLNLIEQKIQEHIGKGTILIETQGAEVGQINGLSVLETGGYAFGIPSRITARTYAGNEGVLHIERETEMSGSIHTKGVLTLAGYLGGKFGQKKPLAMTAQLTFEQSYDEVEGDSASSTELYAILSSLSGVPLKQGLAVTGSVDQRGRIQPIGGVNEKIEGFFDVCKKRGFTGEQGVLIPVQNIRNLMLREEVVQAVQQGEFHVYGVSTIEEGLEILTGQPAGEPGLDGKYPEGTLFHAAEKKLQEFGKGIYAHSLETKKLKKRIELP